MPVRLAKEERKVHNSRTLLSFYVTLSRYGEMMEIINKKQKR